jgi:aspartate--ammonia ligase
LNDNLSGVERPVSFGVKGLNEGKCEIVQSLAKWKRMALKRYGFQPGEGLYTDMNAIRRDEDLDNLHSIYVDQWDWEKVLTPEERTIEYLQDIVKSIYTVFKSAEDYICKLHQTLDKILPDQIFFISAQELEDMYPGLCPKEREDAIAKEKGAVFIMQIGGVLKSGERHDGRAPDYDDWNLNGDILFWNSVLERAFEISSMGIRVDNESLLRQLQIAGCQERLQLEFHRELIAGKLPLTVGGGIGQSRICMFFLNKAHVGEVHSSVWSEEMMEACEAAGIALL